MPPLYRSYKMKSWHDYSPSPSMSHSSLIMLYSCCVLFSESCSAEQTHPESGAEHQHGTERSYLVIFITCPITSRQHRASAERWSSLHFTSVTIHLSLARVVFFHLTVTQSFLLKIVFLITLSFLHIVTQLQKSCIITHSSHANAFFPLIVVT